MFVVVRLFVLPQSAMFMRVLRVCYIENRVIKAETASTKVILSETPH